jgi:hypothetical protein
MADAIPGSPAEFHICGTTHNRWLPEKTGVVVVHRGGLGRLRVACSPFDVPPARSGDLPRRDECVVIGDEPLLRIQVTECPTCPRLLQAGLGGDRSNDVESLANLTVDQWSSDPFACVQRLEPIIRMLPPGYYRISLQFDAPTDGEGELFWKSDSSPRDADALRGHHLGEYGFLTATQSPAKFNLSVWDRAKRTFQTHPILALEIGGVLSAVLDGHHRALAAANAGCHVPALVIAQWSPMSTDWPIEDSSDADPSWLTLEQSRMLQTIWRQVSREQMDHYLQIASDIPDAQLPGEYIPHGLQQRYPSVRAVAGHAALVATFGDITDEAVERILSGRIEHLALYRGEYPFETLMHALFGRRDPRAFRIAQRLLKDGEQARRWDEVMRGLATWPCEETDNIFIEYLCRPDEIARPWLNDIIDDYFRDRNQTLNDSVAPSGL